MLGSFIRFSLGRFGNYKSRRFERLGHIPRSQEMKIERYGLSPHFIYMMNVVSDVECDEQNSIVREHPPELAKSTRKVRWLEMNYGVERNDSIERRIGEVEREHVPHAKFDIRIESRRDSHHLLGQVDADDANALIAQVTSDLSRTTADV